MGDAAKITITPEYRQKVLDRAKDSLQRLKKDKGKGNQPFAKIFAGTKEKAIRNGDEDSFLEIFQDSDKDLSGDFNGEELKHILPKIVEKQAYGKSLDRVDIIETFFALEGEGKSIFDIIKE